MSMPLPYVPLEPDEVGRRRTLVERSVALAKEASRERIMRFKNPEAPRRMGKTTAEDDIRLVFCFIDTLALGLDVAIHTDADPMMVLKSMRWKEFDALFPEVVEDVRALIDSIPNRKEKMPADEDVQQQMAACFMAAKEALEQAMMIVQYGPAPGKTEISR